MLISPREESVEGVLQLTFGTSGYEVMVKINEAQECAKLATRCWLWEIYDSLHFCWKQVNSIAVDEMSQKLDA